MKHFRWKQYNTFNKGSFVNIERFICSQWLVLLCTGIVAAENNVALHKHYSMSPSPNYHLCTDNGDAIQLTDGEKRGSSWLDKSTVGWSNATKLIEITIDLEAPEQIDQVLLYGIGGGRADVEYPEYIAILLSVDAKNWRSTGMLDNSGLPINSNQKKPYAFIFDKVNQNAKYVKIIVRPCGHFFFLDEIEVLKSLTNVQISDSTSSNQQPVYQGIEQAVRDIQDYLQMDRDIRGTQIGLKAVGGQLSSTVTQQISEKLTGLRQAFELPAYRMYDKDQLQKYQSDLFKLRAKVYREFYGNELISLQHAKFSVDHGAHTLAVR